MSLMRIRAAGESDLAVMQDIERAAGGWFREIGMPKIAENEPLSAEELARYRQDDRAWVAVDAGDVPVAYLSADVVDGWMHIEQVSAHPRDARRGAAGGHSPAVSAAGSTGPHRDRRPAGQRASPDVYALTFLSLTVVTIANSAW
jgi:hypothetical protein